MKLIKDIESVASKFEAELSKLWNKEPKIAAVTATTLTFVGPLLEAVFTGVGGPAAGAAAGLVIGKVQQDLLAVNKLVTIVGPTPSVKAIIVGAQQDLSELLTAAQIENPTSIANINLVIGELAALANAFPTPTPVTPAVSKDVETVEHEVEAGTEP